MIYSGGAVEKKLNIVESTPGNLGFNGLRKVIYDQNHKHINVLVLVLITNFDDNLTYSRANLEAFWVR